MNISLESIIGSDRLPSLPEIGMRVVEIARQDEPDFVELTQVIKTDPAIASRILKTANSAAFGMRQRFTSIESALPVLGARMVRTLVLGFSLAGNQFKEVSREHLRKLWRKSLTQASAAEFLAQRTAPEKTADWFLAGMLQDIGQLALLNFAPQEYQQLFSNNDFLADQCCIERSEFGIDHVEVSVEMCRQWNFETELIDAISSHHLPLETNPAEFGDLSSLSVTLQVANAAGTLLQQITDEQQTEIESLQNRLHESYEMAPEDTVLMLEDICQRVNEIAASFGMDVSEPPTPDAIVASAQSILVEIAMQSQLEEMSAKNTTVDTVRELEELKTESNAIRQRANRDALTGVYNRSYLDEVLADELQECQLAEQSVGVVFLDIDHFKTINDTWGHQTGDEAIRLVADVLKKSTRATDMIVRYGGDEFVVVLPNVSEKVCRNISERIRENMMKAELSPTSEVKLTVSVGAIFLNSDDLARADIENFIPAADEAMYTAKTGGRNAVSFLLASESNLFDAKA